MVSMKAGKKKKRWLASASDGTSNSMASESLTVTLDTACCAWDYGCCSVVMAAHGEVGLRVGVAG